MSSVDTTVERASDAVRAPFSPSHPDVVLDCHIKDLYYGAFKAVRDTAIPIKRNSITAFIGPSGCGKSTVLRCLNRMNDLVRGFRFEGHVRYRGRVTRRIEELMKELRERFTIVIVTHNLQQAQRVADYTGFLYVDTQQGGRTGYLVEFAESQQLFQDPAHPHTQQYIRGEFS